MACAHKSSLTTSSKVNESSICENRAKIDYEFVAYSL